MRGVAATFMDAFDAAQARADLDALDPAPASIAGGRLGAAGRQDDGAILLAIHIDEARVDMVRTIVERHRGEVIDVINVGGP
jgi:hypothetical protein